MGDDFQRDAVDARAAIKAPPSRRGSFLAVVPRQVAARDADLLFDQVEIIEQPFRGRRDLAPCLTAAVSSSQVALMTAAFSASRDSRRSAATALAQA
jgi:hypothetical protein